MVYGGLNGVESHSIVAEGNMTKLMYRDEILNPVAGPLVQQLQLILQQDNARRHVASVCRGFLANNNIVSIDWPPYSPNFSPIEYLWNDQDRMVRKHQNLRTTVT